MLKQIVKRHIRAPWPAVAVWLFAVILSVALCGLHASSEQEAEIYREAYRTIPVTITVSNLTGVKTNNLDIPGWAENVFSGTSACNDSLSQFVKDLKIKAQLVAEEITINGDTFSGITVVGLTDFAADHRFTANASRLVTWNPGYDETVLNTEEMVCLVPEEWILDSGKYEEVEMVFTHTEPYPEPAETLSQKITLQIAGSHHVDDNQVFLPYYVVKNLYSGIGKPLSVDCISATLTNNHDLEEVRERAQSWFAEPNLKGEKTPWDYSWYSAYPYALKIDDSQLKSAAEAMENSIRINQICTVLVFVLAAGAGFFIGFLMIRNRKREIVLMRTMGTSGRGICGSFTMEQILCVIPGVMIGGAAFLWRPIGYLTLFVSVYLAGLIVALLVLLHTNLLATIKEDE